MGFLSRLKAAILGPEPPKATALFGFDAYGGIPPSVTDATLPTAYQADMWVKACTDRIAECVASVPLVTRVKRRSEWQDAPDHPLARLLDYVNVRDNGDYLKGATSAWLSLDGNAYWQIGRASKSGPPAALWILPSDRVRVGALAEGKTLPDHYNYQPDGAKKPTPIPFRDIVHIRRFSLDWWYGQGDILALKGAINEDQFLSRHNEGFLRRGGIPAGLLKADNWDAMTNEQREAFNARWDAQTNREQYGRPPKVSTGVTFEKTGITLDTVLAQRYPQEVRNRIIAGMGAYPAIVGVLEQATFANIREQDKMLWTVTVIPRVNRILGAVNEQLAPQFGDDVQVFADFDGIEALREDKQAMGELAKDLVGMALLSPNEARVKYLGESAVEDPAMDAFYISSTMVPVGESINAGSPANHAPAEEAPTNDQGPPSGEPESDEAGGQPAKAGGAFAKFAALATEKRAVRMEQGARVALWKANNTRRDSWAKRFVKPQLGWYDDLEAEVLANLDKAKGLFVGHVKAPRLEVLLFDEDDAGEALALALRPVYLDAYAQLGQVAIDAAVGGINFDLDNPRARALLEARELEMKTVAANAQQRCRDALSEGMANGETVDQLRDRVLEWAETGREAYAENVARTESGIVLNEASREGYQQAGATGTEWLSIVDDRSRPDHADMDGEVRAFGETFDLDSGSYSGPGDPAMGPEDVCNCRCSVAAVFEE